MGTTDFRSKVITDFEQQLVFTFILLLKHDWGAWCIVTHGGEPIPISIRCRGGMRRLRGYCRDLIVSLGRSERPP
jgi:hypothetical protein